MTHVVASPAPSASATPVPLHHSDLAPLFEDLHLGPLSLENRIVMAPMTRSRSEGNVPGDLVATYYRQRTSAGLIVTEGTSPSADGLGYPRIPGLFDDAQEAGWRKVGDAIAGARGHIYVQLMHTGRVTHPDNVPSGALEGGQPIAPSAVPLETTKMVVDGKGELPIPAPREMTKGDIERVVADFRGAAKRARRAGLHGVELHAANGYLIEQFLSPATNHRTDDYGGSIENRARFLLEVARAVSNEIGADRVGVRVSPYGVFNEMSHHSEIEDTYTYLARALSEIGACYVHVVDHSSMGAPTVPFHMKHVLRHTFAGRLILSGGYDAESAAKDIATNTCDLVAFGRPFIANPDLPHRFRLRAPLAMPRQELFYSPGEEGYTDYGRLEPEPRE